MCVFGFGGGQRRMLTCPDDCPLNCDVGAMWLVLPELVDGARVSPWFTKFSQFVGIALLNPECNLHALDSLNPFGRRIAGESDGGGPKEGARIDGPSRLVGSLANLLAMQSSADAEGQTFTWPDVKMPFWDSFGLHLPHPCARHELHRLVRGHDEAFEAQTLLSAAVLDPLRNIRMIPPRNLRQAYIDFLTLRSADEATLAERRQHAP